MRSLLRLIAVALVACALPSLAAAQAATGSLAGRIVDDAGRPVAGATLTASLADGSYRRSATSDARGTFLVSSLPPGTYELRVQRLGHRPAHVRNIAINAGGRAEVALTLARSAQELAPIVVEGSTVRVEAEKTAFETRITESAIARLPVGVDASRLVQFTPGARPDQLWGGSGTQANAYQINGVTATHPGTGGALIQPNISWIEQIDIRGIGAGAAYGGFQGGLIDVVTKSGTNTREGRLRVALETHQLNGSNLSRTEDTPELQSRNEFDGEVRGPIVRDRLFYYVSAQGIRSTRRGVDHLKIGTDPDGFAPMREQADELRGLAKLTFTPASGDLLNASAGITHFASNHWGFTGRETREATPTRSAPTIFGELAWERPLGRFGHVDVRTAAVRADDHRAAGAGLAVPGVATYQVATTRQFQNAAFEERMRPTSLSGTATWRATTDVGNASMRWTAGVEATRGTWQHTKTRTGGMTWRPRYYHPVSQSFVPDNPATWDSIIPTGWGGEIDIDSRTTSASIFAENEIQWGRLTLVPGVRASRWTGSIRDTTGRFITPVRTNGVDPRFGGVLDLSGVLPDLEAPVRRLLGMSPSAPRAGLREPTFVVKAHWGRYHQSVFAEMFDRAAGTSAYSDQELWEYLGNPGTDAHRTFTRDERDALAAQGLFRPFERIELSQTGRVENLKQPYVDQRVLGIEKSFFGHFRLGALWMRRENHNLVALVDRNIDKNWTTFEDVRVFFRGEQLYDHDGEPLVLENVYVRNDMLRYILRQQAFYSYDPDLRRDWLVPGFTPADTANLSYDPDFVLTNPDEARREFKQFQFTASANFPSWNLNYSAAYSTLVGNLFSVSGYDAASVAGRDRLEGRGPGPFVRPNERTNFWGNLDNYSTLEVKLYGSMNLPWQFRLGGYFAHVSGDRLTPDFTISRQGMTYTAMGGGATDFGLTIKPQLISTADGHRIFTAPRGSYKYKPRQSLDVRLARAFTIMGEEWELAAEGFNVLGNREVMQVNTHLIAQADPNFDVNFFDPLRRMDPRRFRVTAAVSF